MNKVLITGGAGFIGSHLVDACLAQGMHVTVLDDFSTGLHENIPAHPHLAVATGSVGDPALCDEVTKSVHTIFHLAAKTSVPDSVQYPIAYYTTNIQGTYTLLEAARSNQVPYFIFSSSAAVYGAQREMCDEGTTPCDPASPYGTSKYVGELLCKEYSRLYSLRTVCLRYFNVYGPRQRADLPSAGFVARVRHAMLHDEPITIYGDGSQQRNFVPVTQIVAANMLLADRIVHEPWQGEVFNVASAYSETLLSFIKRVHAEFPHYDLARIQFVPARPGDVAYSAARCSKFERILESSS